MPAEIEVTKEALLKLIELSAGNANLEWRTVVAAISGGVIGLMSGLLIAWYQNRAKKKQQGVENDIQLCCDILETAHMLHENFRAYSHYHLQLKYMEAIRRIVPNNQNISFPKYERYAETYQHRREQIEYWVAKFAKQLRYYKLTHGVHERIEELTEELMDFGWNDAIGFSECSTVEEIESKKKNLTKIVETSGKHAEKYTLIANEIAILISKKHGLPLSKVKDPLFESTTRGRKSDGEK